MTEDEIRSFAARLPGVAVVVAAEGDGSPEIAWGDTFMFYDPDDKPESRRMPFATIVTKNYPGFDEASNLNREGVFRFNIGVGRDRFRELCGDQPVIEDPAALDHLMPHPTYAAQFWVS